MPAASKRITSPRQRVKHADVPLGFEWSRFTTNIGIDFEWWMGEYVKHTIDRNERFGDGSEQGLRWDIELVESSIDDMQRVCERLQQACDSANAIAHCKEQIRHMREDSDGFEAVEVENRKAKADELEGIKLVELEAALATALR